MAEKPTPTRILANTLAAHVANLVVYEVSMNSVRGPEPADETGRVYFDITDTAGRAYRVTVERRA